MESLKNAASGVGSYVPSFSGSGNPAGDGKEKWDAMSEEQKKTTFDNLPEEQKHNKSYYEWIQEGYHKQYENWMPWIEDQYLKWFTNDNKASYAAKDTLDKSKITGIDQVDKVQDDVNNLAANQVGKDGLLQPVGDMTSKEGINRAERGGKDEDGDYAGGAASGGPASTVTDGAKGAGEGLANAGSGAAGAVGGMMGGGKKE